MTKRAEGPLGRGRSIRRPVRALHYWVPVPRVSDAWAGNRDGRHDGRTVLAAAQAGGGGYRSALTLWLTRNAHTFAERDRREFLHAQAAVADQRSALHRLYEAADRQAREVDRVRAARAAAPDQPTREELEARGPAEGLDPADVIAKRRRVEHAAHLAGLDAQVQAAASRAEQIAEQIAAIEGELVTVFEITVTRSARLRHYHERRAAVYRRWHRRAWHRRARGSSSVPEWPLHDADATIPVPAWTTEPCPWVHPRATAASAAA